MSATTLCNNAFTATSLSSRFTNGSRAAFASSTAAKPSGGVVSGFQFHVVAKQNKVARTILTQKQRTYNKARQSEIATRMKKVRTLAEVLLPSATEENVLELEKLISEATKTVDKAVAKGVLHKNTGARRKSRMARMKQGVLKANNLMTYN
jgi:small subunit ribosomal protein S20